MPAPVIPNQLRNLAVIVDTEVMKARRMAANNWDAVAIKKVQTKATGLYAWANDIPYIIRKQANGYLKSGLSLQSFSLTSEEFGLFLEIKKQDWRDQNLDNILSSAADFGQRIEQFPQDNVWALFKEGDAATYQGQAITAFDGLSFFNDAHYVNGRNTADGTFDNNLTGTALTAPNVAAAEAALALIPDNRGKALNQPVTHIIVPPQLATAAYDVVWTRTLSTGGVNVQSPEGRAARGLPSIQVIVVPELAGDPTTWYVVSRASSRAPIIWQETEALHTIPLLEETMPHVLYDNIYMWAVKGESVFGFGDPRTAIRLIA
jgi:phage major head subunit gpT-like protein